MRTNFAEILPLFGLAALAGLASCESLSNLDPRGIGGASNGAATIVENMKKQPAPFLLQLPPRAEVGTWWEHTMAGGASKTKYSVVGQRGTKLLVESPMQVGEATIVQAWLVDPSIDFTKSVQPGQPAPSNVSQAWIGVDGGEPLERPVMKPTTVQASTAGATNVAASTGRESLELAGHTWDCTWTEASGSKSWIAAGTTFSVKATHDGKTVLELTGFGDGAEARLTWE